MRAQPCCSPCGSSDRAMSNDVSLHVFPLSPLNSLQFFFVFTEKLEPRDEIKCPHYLIIVIKSKRELN